MCETPKEGNTPSFSSASAFYLLCKCERLWVGPWCYSPLQLRGCSWGEQEDGVSIPFTDCSDRALQSPGGRKSREKSGYSLIEPISPRNSVSSRVTPAEELGRRQGRARRTLQQAAGAGGQPTVLQGGQPVFVITRC